MFDLNKFLSILNYIWENLDKFSDITTTITIIFLIVVIILTQKQVKAALGASSIRIFELIFSDLNSKEARENRKFIYSYSLTPEQIILNDSVHNRVENVCVSLDRVGVLLTSNLLPKGNAQQIYFDMYCDVFIHCWEELKEYVNFIRKIRTKFHYNKFQELAEMSKKDWQRVKKITSSEIIKKDQNKTNYFSLELPDGENPFTRLSFKTICKKPKTRFNVRLDRVRNIKTKLEFDYSVAEIGPSVGIVAINDEKDIILVGQWRYTLNKYSWEIPTGTIDIDENKVEAAKRELLEETGIIANKWIELGSIDNSNGSTTDIGYLFLASDLRYEEPNRDPNEIIKLYKVNICGAIDLVYENKITESLSVAAILKAGRYIATYGIN